MHENIFITLLIIAKKTIELGACREWQPPGCREILPVSPFPSAPSRCPQGNKSAAAKHTRMPDDPIFLHIQRWVDWNTERTWSWGTAEPTAPEESLKEIAPAPAVQPSAEQTTPEASSTPADMQNMLAVLLSQLMKTQEPAGNLEENNSDKNSGPQGPRRTPTMPQEEAAGKQTGHESHWAQVLLILLKISNVFFFTSVASVSVFL